MLVSRLLRVSASARRAWVARAVAACGFDWHHLLIAAMAGEAAGSFARKYGNVHHVPLTSPDPTTTTAPCCHCHGILFWQDAHPIPTPAPPCTTGDHEVAWVGWTFECRNCRVPFHSGAAASGV